MQTLGGTPGREFQVEQMLIEYALKNLERFIDHSDETQIRKITNKINAVTEDMIKPYFTK